MLKLFKMSTVIWVITLSLSAKADPNILVRSFTLTPGYMERTFNSNEMMKYGPLSIMQLSTKGFDIAVGVVDHPVAKVAVAGVCLFPYSIQLLAARIVYHEYGHCRAHASLGGEYEYRHYDKDKRANHAFAFFSALINPSHWYSTNAASVYKNRINYNRVPKKLIRMRDDNNFLDMVDLYVGVAGLNNQMRYAQEVSDLVFHKNGHLLYFGEYLADKITPCIYTLLYEKALSKNKVDSGDDIHRILDKYQKLKISVNASDIKIGSVASVLISSTTWAFMYSAFTELPKGSFIVRAPVWHGWRLPDLNFYLTTHGLSFEVVTGYQFNDSWYAGLTAEMVYKGNTAYEFGPSIGYKLNTSIGEFALSAQAIIGKDMEFGGNTGIEWTSLCKDWTVGLKYIYHNALTLVGERNIPFLCSGFMSGGEPSHTNHELNLTLSYNY